VVSVYLALPDRPSETFVAINVPDLSSKRYALSTAIGETGFSAAV